jgi:hypothetical protein
LAAQVKSQVPLPEQTLVPLTGAGAQDRQLFDPKQPVWTVFPAQTPPQRCCPAGQPMPDPVLPVVAAALDVAVLLLVAPEVVVAPVLALVLVAPLTPPAPVVAGSLPPPLVAPGPSATPPPTPPPPKPPSPSLLALVSAALAQP